MSCELKVWVEDLGDGYSGKMACGGQYQRIGTTNLEQCDSCKTVREPLGEGDNQEKV
jgi:hypothetical protein